AQRTGGNVCAGYILRSGYAGELPFYRQPTGEPVGLARGVPVHLDETEALESPRGSGAYVSLGVVAVHDDGVAALKLRGHVPIQRLERDVASARQMLGLVLLRREHVDELRPLSNELLHLVAINGRWHRVSPLSLPCAARLRHEHRQVPSDLH